MKIITRKSQDRATAHLMQIMSAIFSHDDIELLNSLGAVAELAYIIGGIGMMETLKPNSSEKLNNSTRSKMEQVDKDTNVRSKDCTTCRFDDKYGDESICSDCSRHYSDCYEPKTEPTISKTENVYKDCETCKYKNHNWWSNKCDPCCRGDSHYEPKDEHSGEVTEMVEPQKCYLRESCDHYGDKQVCGRCREYNLYSHTKTEPQTETSTNEGKVQLTDCAWKGEK